MVNESGKLGCGSVPRAAKHYCIMRESSWAHPLEVIMRKQVFFLTALAAMVSTSSFCSQLATAETGNADELGKEGVKLVKQGNFDDAVKNFSRAIRIDPTN